MNRYLTGHRPILLRAILPMLFIGTPLLALPAGATGATEIAAQQNNHSVKGTVTDAKGEPLIGVSVVLQGTSQGTVTDVDGHFNLSVGTSKANLVFSYIGYTTQTVAIAGKKELNVILQEEHNVLNEVVVTALGIRKKETSLTYATQQVKSDDLNKVQDPNLANSLQGKVSGITITPNAGGAGGGSQILLRGFKSIMGKSEVLVVVDGIPYSNDIKSQASDPASLGYSTTTEGSDPLSMLNSEDIESINVLKGANAAALYGSVAARGALIITTKKGREGKLAINVNSNVTFDTPLVTPNIQNDYGATVSGSGNLSAASWGDRLFNRSNPNLVVQQTLDNKKFNGEVRDIYLRNNAGNDLSDFYRTGVTTNNTISLSGGTEKLKTYFSYGNSHSNGMLRENSYNKNTFAFRQSYDFFKRVHFDLSLNYLQSVTRNRVGGGTTLNPIYHMYTMPRNVDIGYYRNNYVQANGHWNSEPQSYFAFNKDDNTYTLENGTAALTGDMQNWVFMEGMQNNPYWLLKRNTSRQDEEKVFGTFAGTLDIIDGLSLQARVRFDRSKYSNDSRRYATTFLPAGMDDYGHYWKSYNKTSEIYTDYMLNYNKSISDWSISAQGGWIGHVVKGETVATDVVATYENGYHLKVPTMVNLFETVAGGKSATSQSKMSNWDKALFATASIGWQDKVYIDGSYRYDWYRAYRQFRNRGNVPDAYGYWGVGGNAIVSSLVKLPEWFNFLKYRVSYAGVGNSIPYDIVYSGYTKNYDTGAITLSPYGYFENPTAEMTYSFETGFESLFFNNRLSVDFTFYNTIAEDLYMLAVNASAKNKPMNSAKVRNRGVEANIAYNFNFGSDFSWRTSYNFSYNDNKILKTAYLSNGMEAMAYTDIPNVGVRVKYLEGGSMGDMYITDYKRDENGHFVLTSEGKTQMSTDPAAKYTKYAGNMNAKWQMGWSNTFRYKDFSLYFLINGRIGGKVISATEAYLDNLGLSQRSADARIYAEKHNLIATDYGTGKDLGMYLPDGSGRVVPIQAYYESIGGTKNPNEYIYNGTNFRLRELSLGYTFRDLFGQNKNLTMSFIARNLFFLYKDSPVDPDVSLSTATGLSGIEMFNLPSSRSFGFSLGINL